MKVTVARGAGSIAYLDIAADEAEFAEAMNAAYRKIARDVNIPGFRKGKAPRHIVERMVGKTALIEEAGMGMMDDLYRRALEQENLTPVSDPEVNVTEVNPIAFTVTVQVYPEVTLGDYQSVRVDPVEVNVEESEIDETIETMRKNVAEWVPLDEERKPQEGDQVIIDMTVYDGDEVFQEPATDMPWVLGEANMFEALEDAIKDMEVGTSEEVTLAFDEDDESVAPDIRGKSLRYEITLKSVNVRDLPEVDDEFAGRFGEIASVEELREEVRKDLLRGKVTEAQTQVVNEIVNKMAEVSEVDVPAAMVDMEIDNQVTQTRSRLAQTGTDLETFLSMTNKTEEDFREELREDAARRVRNTLVLNQIAEVEGLTVTDEDIEAEIDRMTAGMANAEQLRSIYASEYFRERLENDLHDRRMTERIIEIATEGVGAVTGEGAKLLQQDEEEAADADAEEAEETVVDVEASVEDDSADASEDEASSEEAEDEDSGDEADDAGDAEEASSDDEDADTETS